MVYSQIPPGLVLFPPMSTCNRIIYWFCFKHSVLHLPNIVDGMDSAFEMDSDAPKNFNLWARGWDYG